MFFGRHGLQQVTPPQAIQRCKMVVGWGRVEPRFYFFVRAGGHAFGEMRTSHASHGITLLKCGNGGNYRRGSFPRCFRTAAPAAEADTPRMA